jgi:hypothetical protein
MSDKYWQKKKIDQVVKLLLLLITYHLSLITISCGGGDDDGRRLGELIVGTWQRGWDEGDVIIEGDTDLEPGNFSYDRFVFMPDGKYNGMIRDGSFSAYDEFDDIIYEGTYRCDNNNLKLEFINEEGRRQTILAQVLSFTDDTMILRYENEEYNVTVTLTLRKRIDVNYSSSSASAS